MITRLFSAALIAGAITGIIAAILQIILSQPILELAETLEVTLPQEHSHDHTHEHDHNLTRYALNIIANIISFCGFALITVAVMATNQPNPTDETIMQRTQKGICYGIAGYLSVVIAPTIGLPPELPGMPAAEINARQIWWIATVIATATALYIACLAQLPKWKYSIAAILIIAPHIYGAPHIETAIPTIPAEWSALFVARSLGISCVAWIILGVMTATLFYKKPTN